MGASSIILRSKFLTLFSGRSDAPSRLSRPQNHIPVILPLDGGSFWQVTEEVGQKQKKIRQVHSIFPHNFLTDKFYIRMVRKKSEHTLYAFDSSSTLLALILIPIKQADERVIFVGLLARTV